jgi:hypothetical protein
MEGTKLRIPVGYDHLGNYDLVVIKVDYFRSHEGRERGSEKDSRL